MALIKCSECETNISDKAVFCPHCGIKDNTSINNLKKDSTAYRFFYVSGILLILITVFLIVLFLINGKTVDLEKTYEKIGCIFTYCDISSDGSFIYIDTNPSNKDDFSNEDAFNCIKDANSELGFNDALYYKMSITRASDGILNYNNDKINVSWTYHPNTGLEVLYYKK